MLSHGPQHKTLQVVRLVRFVFVFVWLHLCDFSPLCVFTCEQDRSDISHIMSLTGLAHAQQFFKPPHNWSGVCAPAFSKLKKCSVHTDCKIINTFYCLEFLVKLRRNLDRMLSFSKFVQCSAMCSSLVIVIRPPAELPFTNRLTRTHEWRRGWRWVLFSLCLCLCLIMFDNVTQDAHTRTHKWRDGGGFCLCLCLKMLLMIM